MTVYLGIDPGPTESGWCVYATGPSEVIAAGVDVNADLVCPGILIHGEQLIIEQPVSYGAAIGASVLQTMRWAGRFEQWFDGPVHWVSRPDVCLALTGHRGNKGQINEKLREMHPGATPGQQRKGSPLYGLKSHAWDACAVVVAWLELERQKARA